MSIYSWTSTLAARTTYSTCALFSPNVSRAIEVSVKSYQRLPLTTVQSSATSLNQKLRDAHSKPKSLSDTETQRSTPIIRISFSAYCPAHKSPSKASTTSCWWYSPNLLTLSTLIHVNFRTKSGNWYLKRCQGKSKPFLRSSKSLQLPDSNENF